MRFFNSFSNSKNFNDFQDFRKSINITLKAEGVTNKTVKKFKPQLAIDTKYQPDLTNKLKQTK